ncbi:LOW QUALITY PROTEIN: hypothetical protein U0070_005222, partial [Myodes glareolus]
PVTLPFIQATNTTVKELDTVFLTCFSNDTGIPSNRSMSLELTDEKKISQTKNTLTIDPVRREDSGKYRCEVSNPVSSKWSDPNQLDIIVLEMGLILYQQCAKWPLPPIPKLLLKQFCPTLLKVITFFYNITQKDAGAYMLRMIMGNLEVRDVSVQFHVHP